MGVSMMWYKWVFFVSIYFLAIESSADLTTAQKITCAKKALKKILSNDFQIIDETIDLEPTPMEKYNLPAKGINKAFNLEMEQNYVTFEVQNSNGTYSGKIAMQTEPKDSYIERLNNTTVDSEDLFKKSFVCTLIKTQFTGTKKTNANITESDLNLRKKVNLIPPSPLPNELGEREMQR